VAKLFDRIAPRYQERPGGYTRIIKLGARAGDNASLAIIELVEEEFTPRPRKAAPAVAALGAPVAASIAAEAGSVEDLPAEGVIEAGEAESEEKKDA